MRICLAVSTKYLRVTDRQRDGHLATAESALCIASRSKNDSRSDNSKEMKHSQRKQDGDCAYIAVRTPECDLITSIVFVKPLFLFTGRHVLCILEPGAEQKVFVCCQQLVNVQQQVQHLLTAMS